MEHPTAPAPTRNTGTRKIEAKPKESKAKTCCTLQLTFGILVALPTQPYIEISAGHQ